MIEGRKVFLSKLNKDYWKRYFDYDALEKWANFENNPEYDEAISNALGQCLLAEVMVKRSKELKEN